MSMMGVGPMDPMRSQKKERGRQNKAASSGQIQRYLSCVEMLENVVFNSVPRPFTAAMIAIEMPAAIKPYSIAVAAD